MSDFTINMRDEGTRARVLLLTHMHGLALEINTGLKLSNRGPALSTVIKRHYQITGSKVELLGQLVGMMENADYTYQMSASIERAMSK